MIRKIRLRNFKNFEDATLELGPLTTLIGANASGKSNLRDAFRFLHGISRGYNLAEIIGEKWGEGGVLQWGGIRGGTREVSFQDKGEFELAVWFDLQSPKNENKMVLASYTIRVKVGDGRRPSSVLSESLNLNSRPFFEFEDDSLRNDTVISFEKPSKDSRDFIIDPFFF